MKNKIILLIVVAGAALAYHFQDQLTGNQKNQTAVVETSKPVEAPTNRPRNTDPLKIENIIINKTFGQFYTVPPMLEKMTEGLNKLFEFEKQLTFNVNYVYYDSFEAVPPEKWKTDSIITRTLAALELVKQGKEVELLFFVSPLPVACYQEVQVVALLDSKVGSAADLSNKDIFVEGLQGVNNLPLRRFVTDEDFAPKTTTMNIGIDAAIEQMFQQKIEAAVVYSGHFTPLNQVSKNFRILKTSDYKIPCYTLLVNKRIPQDTRDTLIKQILSASQDKGQREMLRAAIGVDTFEEVTPEVIKDLQDMAKKYEKAEMKVYTPPVVEEKAPEVNAATTPVLTPEQMEIEKQRAMMQEMEKQQEEAKAQQEKKLKELQAQQEKQFQEMKLLQEKLQQQQRPPETPNNQFKSPQEIMQEQKI